MMFARISLTALIAVTAILAAPLDHLARQFPTGAPLGVAVATKTWASTGPGSTSVFPLSNGFPNVKNPSAQLQEISDQAHGQLSNGPAPSSVKPVSITNLKWIAFNELAEIAFFTELLANITSNVTGYTFPDSGVRQFIIDTLIAAQGQEELHSLNANGFLAKFNVASIQPCQYDFPVSDFDSAMALAIIFTDMFTGAFQDVSNTFAADGDLFLIRHLGSVIGQEAQQSAFYRLLLNKIPNALPYQTIATIEFAYGLFWQTFVVAGSCPNSKTIDVAIFQPLAIVSSPVLPQNQTLTFQVDVPQADAARFDSYGVVYINQGNLPVTEPLTDITVSGETVTFFAQFPYDEFHMNGLTLAAVTSNKGPFADVDAVANVTLFGPGIIEIN